MRSAWLLVLLAACGGGSSTGTGTGAGTGTGNTTAVPCDVSDEPKAAAIYEQVTGVHLDLDGDACIDMSPTFVGWVQFGSFANDRGCEYDQAIYDCKLTDFAAGKKAMADAGWANADQARRQELLVAFLGEIMNVRLVMQDYNNEFPKYQQTFTPPAFDGASITYWESDAGGMSPEVTYTQMKWPVDADGMLGAPEQLAQFTTVYE